MRLDSPAVFLLPGETWARSLLMKNISIEQASPSDHYLRDAPSLVGPHSAYEP